MTKEIKILYAAPTFQTCLEDVSKVMKHANSLPLADYDYWAIEKCFTTAVGVQRAHMLNMSVLLSVINFNF